MSDEAVLVAKNISKGFGGIQALRNVDLNVQHGTIHGLIGPNGAGKTTMFNVMSGYLRADTGSVRFAGEEILGLKPYVIAQKGLVRTFQAVKQLSQMSVYDNMKSGMYRTGGSGGFWPRFMKPNASKPKSASEQHSRIMELLAEVQLVDKAQYKASSLSFGELRFLDVARAMAAEPRVLLVDEPAAGLNNEEVSRLEGLLKSMKGKDLTIVLIEHDVELVFRLCDQITVLDFGGVIATGIPEAVRCNPAVMAAYLGVEVEAEAPKAMEVQ